VENIAIKTAMERKLDSFYLFMRSKLPEIVQVLLFAIIATDFTCGLIILLNNKKTIPSPPGIVRDSSTTTIDKIVISKVGSGVATEFNDQICTCAGTDFGTCRYAAERPLGIAVNLFRIYFSGENMGQGCYVQDFQITE
jgi:hypothetical protein